MGYNTRFDLSYKIQKEEEFYEEDDWNDVDKTIKACIREVFKQ